MFCFDLKFVFVFGNNLFMNYVVDLSKANNTNKINIAIDIHVQGVPRNMTIERRFEDRLLSLNLFAVFIRQHTFTSMTFKTDFYELNIFFLVILGCGDKQICVNILIIPPWKIL